MGSSDGHGLVGKGSARLWESLELDWRTIPVMHSAVTLDDLTAVLLRAERLLAQPLAGGSGDHDRRVIGVVGNQTPDG